MLDVIRDFLHLLATVTWVGGMIYINLALMPALTAIDPPQRGKLMGAAGKRFAILSWSSVLILLITGYMKTPSGMLFEPSTGYGLTLTVKHLAILVMMIVGIYISMVIVPKLGTLAPKAGEPPSAAFIKVQKSLPVLSITNMVLGVVVLFCVALLRL